MTTATASRWRLDVDDVPVAVAANARLIAIAGAAGSAVLYDVGAAGILAEVRLEGGLLGAEFSPGGGHLALTGPAGHRLWHAADRRADPPALTGWAARAAWSGEDRVAIAAGRSAVVLSGSGAPLWRTAPAPSTVTDLCWRRDGRELAVSAYNGVYRHARHQVDPVSELAYPGSHLAIAASADDRWICTGNQDASVHIWRARDGRELEMAGYAEKVTRLAFDPTGRWLANDGAPDVTVWDFAGKGPGGSSPRMLGAHERVTALAWRPGTDALLATGGQEGRVALWSVASARAGKVSAPQATADLGEAVTALCWAGGALVAATRSGSVAALDVAAMGAP